MKKLIVCICVLLLFPSSCMVITGIGFHITEKKFIVKLNKEIPDNFPILIVRDEKSNIDAKLIYYGQLEQFTKEGVYTFLVPEGSQAKLNNIIQNNKISRGGLDVPWTAYFKVLKENNDGSQYIMVELNWDDDDVNKGWYKATEDVIIPDKYLSYFGPGLALSVIPTAFIVNIFLWLSIYITYRIIYRKKIKRSKEICKDILNNQKNKSGFWRNVWN